MDMNELSIEELKAELARRENSKHDKRRMYRELVEERIPAIFERIVTASRAISDLKTDVFLEVQELIRNKKAAYGTRDGQQTHTLTSSGGHSIMIGYRVLDGWDDTVHAGIEKVNKFIASLATNEDSAKLVSLVQSLLKKDAKGNLKASRVIELRNLTDEFNSEDFSDGVDIIQKAYSPTRSCWFLEAWQKDEMGNKVNIPLSVSAADFVEDAGSDIDFEIF